MSTNPFMRTNGFGQQANPPPTFGKGSAALTFGKPTTAFGQPVTQPYSASVTPAFGQPQNKGFGQPVQNKGFGQRTTPAATPFAQSLAQHSPFMAPAAAPAAVAAPPATPGFSFPSNAGPPAPAATPGFSFASNAAAPAALGAPAPAAPGFPFLSNTASPSLTTPVTSAAPTLTTPAPALVIDGVTASTPDATELAERQPQAPMFNDAVRRDLYAFLVNPNAPGLPLPASLGTARASSVAGVMAAADAVAATPAVSSRFGVALLAKHSGLPAASGVVVAPGADLSPVDTFAFVDCSSLQSATLPAGWRRLDDATLLGAIDHLGEVAPLPLAALKAFEKHLERKASLWTDAEVARLSLPFLVCFGRELTPRLDVYHRIRSTALSADELRLLSNEPYVRFVDAEVVRRYQKVDVPPAPVALLSLSTPKNGS